MRFFPVTRELSTEPMKQEYKDARAIGVIRIGEEMLYFRVKTRVYYVPYADIKHAFRRVNLVAARMCCGKGDFRIENLVIGDAESELAVIQLPGTRAAQELMKVLKEKMPECDFSAPHREENQEEGTVGTLTKA